MANEIVQYHNDLNTLQMSGFTEKEIDIFFSLCYKLKNQGSNKINVSYSEIRELSNFKHRSIDKIHDSIDSTFKKLLGLSIKIENEITITRFVLFTDYIIDKEKKCIDIQVHDKFRYLLNDFMSNYTRFELKELVSLKSIYSKNIYKILKQYRNTGWYEASLDKLRNLLDVPESYDTNNFNKRVLAPILEELPKYFLNLRVEKIKKGRKIHKLRFMWDLKTVQEIEVMPKEDVIDEAMQNKINAVKTAISVLDDTEILALLDVADMGVILEKYYTLAVGKNIDNLTGFLMAAIKNDWKKTPKKAEEKKAVQGEMDELERKLQKRLFDKLNNRGI